MPGGTAFARPTGFVGPVSEAPPGNWAALRPDALTPALSHREREKAKPTSTSLSGTAANAGFAGSPAPRPDAPALLSCPDAGR